VIAVLFGILAFVMPGITLAVLLFGVLMIALALKLHGLLQRRTTAPSAA
jgi:hypothetical protein